MHLIISQVMAETNRAVGLPAPCKKAIVDRLGRTKAAKVDRASSAQEVRGQVVENQISAPRNLEDKLRDTSPGRREVEDLHLGIQDVERGTHVLAVVIGGDGYVGRTEASGYGRADCLKRSSTAH